MYVFRKTGFVIDVPHEPPDLDVPQVYKVTKYGRVLTLREENQVHKGIGAALHGLSGWSYYRIIIENDARTCPLCRERDGTVYSTENAVIGVRNWREISWTVFGGKRCHLCGFLQMRCPTY